MAEHAPRRAGSNGFAIGVTAALVMTAIMVILRLTTGVLSLPEILGEAIITLMPAAAFSAILDVMQRAAKPTLYTGIFAGMLAVGGVLGRWFAGGAPSWRRALTLGLIVWVVVGGLAMPLMGLGLFGSAVRAGSVVVGTQLLVAFLGFALSLVLFDRALAPVDANEVGVQMGRRAAIASMLGGVAAVAAGGYAWKYLIGGANRPVASAPEAVAGTASGSGAGATATAELPFGAGASAGSGAGVASGAGAPGAGVSGVPKRGVPPIDAPSVPMTVGPKTTTPAPFDVPYLTSEVHSAKDFYTVSKNLIDPSVDGPTWRLTIDGLVERPTTLDLDGLKSLPTYSDYYTLQCISNYVGGDLWGNAHWKGVRLADLLARTGIKPGARKVVFHAEDEYTDSIVLDAALRNDTLLAYEMNGETLTKEHGFPARLLIPGIYGMKNVKWITRIELVNYDFKGYWMQRGWSDTAPYKTSSRIDAPRNRATLSVGEIQFAGVSFAGARGIDRVEVSLDDGATWQAAQHKPALSQNAWNLWMFTTTLGAGTYPVKVRATDGNGDTQTSRETDPLPDGAAGWHSVLVRVG